MTEGLEPAPTPPGKPSPERFAAFRELVDAELDAVLPPADSPPEQLHAAMRYSVFAGGKRLRPILVLAAGEACGAPPEELLQAACAVELLHTYSLIHDDLPAFDDDELRRGQPTNHVVYGEATAILAGDALQTLAIAQLGRAAAGAEDPRPWIAAITELTDAAGSMGMAGGQCMDIEAEGRSLDLDALRSLHALKTGALLTACVRMGAHVGCADEATMEALTRYGRAIGLAFQIVDDILDVEGSVQDLGKQPGVDADRGKQTYPALLGVEASKAEAERLCADAIAALAPLGSGTEQLKAIADFIVQRSQ